MRRSDANALTAEQRLEVAAWLEQNSATFPEAIRPLIVLLQKSLSVEGNARKAFESVQRELRRALGITASTERRRSGSPLAGTPREGLVSAQTEREKLEGQLDRAERLGGWHGGLRNRHNERVERLRERLAKMLREQSDDAKQSAVEIPRLEDIQLTAEQEAENKAAGAQFAQHLLVGVDAGPDPALKSVNETLMPGGTVLANEEHVSLPVAIPAELAGAEVVKTIHENRVRYDFSVAVTRVELEVEKKVLVDEGGERHVITASTSEYGPRGFGVTWSALATLVVMVGQFAIPLNRLGTMLSTAGKRFTASSLGRMLHYVGERLLPIYLELGRGLANCATLAGDDTSCRVVEVQAYFGKQKTGLEKEDPPWAGYRTPEAADARLRRCEEMTRDRLRRRADGDRAAKRTPDERPSLGVLIGRRLTFESPRRNGDGTKQGMNTTVVSGRRVADDPRSLIVFYRSHLGSFGNLVESILATRDPKLKKLTLQGDLSTTNRITSAELGLRFDIKNIGCTAHARRPFAIHEDDDEVYCSYMLHLFTGLAIHEGQLDEFGRNRENVLAVRRCESRALWADILRLAKEMTERWSPGTKLGVAARYIIKHFDELTAYLDDPELEPTNNLRERMLRLEKLIQGSSMFRRSLEGRFVLDIVRTILQTAVAAGVPVHKYLVSVLRASEEEVKLHPERFTPCAWMAEHHNAEDLAASGA